jgi:hypothetical protein
MLAVRLTLSTLNMRSHSSVDSAPNPSTPSGDGTTLVSSVTDGAVYRRLKATFKWIMGFQLFIGNFYS